MTKLIQIEDLTASELMGALQNLSEKVDSLQNAISKPEKPKVLDDGDYLTAKQTANLLQINPATVWAWNKNGTLIKYRIGKRVYYKRSEVEALLNNSKVGG